ncbi:MAG: ABC transporter permease [Saprospiraceae bacterium]|nr:ABC transporter permease [Saprospiraceae bacterium]
MIIAKIAWKNIWRSPLRSLIVIVSIILGLWAGTFMMAYVLGLMDQRLEDAIKYEISHFQIHHPEYQEDYDPVFDIEKPEDMITSIQTDYNIKSATARVLAMGMVASSNTSTGGKFIGVNPDTESMVSNINDLISEGRFLEASDKNKVVIGQKLAEKLNVRLRSKIVLTFQDVDRNIVAGAFRIVGIYDSYNSSIEERNLYVMDRDLSALLNTPGHVHEIALLLNDPDELDQTVSALSNELSAKKVESWKSISPELSLMVDSMDQSMMIFLIIILLALSFGIVNTMLMAVLERVREIGVLMAIGMTKTRLFFMIFLETVFIIGLAAPLGLLLAYATITYLGNTGMDLSNFYKEGYAAFGFQSMIYPNLGVEYYIKILWLVAVTAILASIYPAITALRLNPVNAIKKI